MKPNLPFISSLSIEGGAPWISPPGTLSTKRSSCLTPWVAKNFWLKSRSNAGVYYNLCQQMSARLCPREAFPSSLGESVLQDPQWLFQTISTSHTQTPPTPVILIRLQHYLFYRQNWSHPGRSVHIFFVAWKIRIIMHLCIPSYSWRKPSSLPRFSLPSVFFVTVSVAPFLFSFIIKCPFLDLLSPQAFISPSSLHSLKGQTIGLELTPFLLQLMCCRNFHWILCTRFSLEVI